MRRLAAEAFEKDGCGCVEICSAIDIVEPLGLFGCHVFGGANDAAALCQLGGVGHRVGEFRKPKVEKLEHRFGHAFADKDVLGFEIAVHDARPVCAG